MCTSAGATARASGTARGPTTRSPSGTWRASLRPLLLEYDTERAGGFEPLRFVRDDAIVVLGLLTTKTGALEDPDLLKRRIEEASRHVPLERLALSPQCGFASGIAGNLISQDEQWRKLERVLEVARDVWG